MNRRKVAIIFRLIQMAGEPIKVDPLATLLDELWAHVEEITGATTKEAQALADEAKGYDWEDAR
jgi:hypothetical protein